MGVAPLVSARFTLLLALLVAAPCAAHVTPPGLQYKIDVVLDPLRHRLHGHETITYRSGADSTLHSIYLHAYPNAFRDHHTIYAREGERWGEDYAIRLATPRERGWMTIDSVTADGAPAAIDLDETVARVDLPRPLTPGKEVTLRLAFTVQVPKPIARFGHVGNNYSVGQWYPKMVVYDDLGWHPDPYHYFAEFYGDYGTFDVSITLPDAFWVGATGLLQSASDGDNEIPLADREMARDSVTVRLRVVTADSLQERWPRAMLSVGTDLEPKPGAQKKTLEVKREKGVTLRVPRGAPVHYTYSWVESERAERREADRVGSPGPLHLLRAVHDLTVTDTLRALAAPSSPKDSVLSSLKTLRFVANRVHDFAWVASPDYVRADTTWNGVAIRALAYREDHDDWRDQRSDVVSAMRFMSREVGPYIWPAFTSAESPVGGGAMEYPMLIMNEPDLPSPWIDLLDITIAHELAHNWFYGMLGSDERAHPWLDEGFTQFMEDRHTDWKHPHGIFMKRRRLPWMNPVRDFSLDEGRYLSRVCARDELPISTPADSFQGWPQYGAAAYSKPAMMLHTLRAYLGDSTFSAFLREYYRKNLLRHPRPQDVIEAAEKVSGEPMRNWFRPWLEGTATADISLRSVRDVTVDGKRATIVSVRRRGEREEPVVVEAERAHGATDRYVIPAGRGIASVEFRGATRVKRVTLDPDHSLIELNRLDNRSGLPPLALKPLVDFPTSDVMTFVYGPMIWQGRSEGIRLGLWTVGRYLPMADFPQGIVSAGGNLVVGTRHGDVSSGVWGSKRVGALGARGRIGLETFRDAGLFRMGARAGNLVTAPGRRHPFREWQLGLDYRDRYDLTPVDPRYWSPGTGLHGKARLALDTQGPRRAEHAEMDLRAGSSVFRNAASDPDVHYERVSVEMRQRLDLFTRGETRLAWRFFAGSAFARPPREIHFDAAEGSRLDSLGRFYLNDRGPLLASGHDLIPGGGGLRGYRGRAALGKRVWGLNTDLEIPTFPFSIFADAGRVEATGLGERGTAPAAGSTEAAANLLGRTLADAGISYTHGPIRITAPLWVSRPDPGRSPLRFRWLFSIEALPISF